MTDKTDIFAAEPELMRQWKQLSTNVGHSIDPVTAALVMIRTSQINGCANCINMHTAEARAQDETEQRIYLLSAWRDAPCYSDRERAALGWTEALTRLSEGHAMDSAKTALAEHFDPEEQVRLTLMINIIAGWNRLATGFGLWIEPVRGKVTPSQAA
ncbi:carboxymuconolactone decarboxylase family protein [Sphingosinithalassobacter portus]|uniref:carboxymuconolactone decarboxylase family protein n=1 Tax=Stakelama portus TaxID=2676234 RepID=UPI000D6E1C80|nr:carboxymuconolactone decarboxylase family protein [Sphingosinithalassobacter portus]